MQDEPEPVAPEYQRAAVQRAQAAWHALLQRLRSVTPSALARSVLVAGAFWVIGSLLVSSWPILSPFVIGGVVAYMVLPIVNRLDAFMPRGLAATLTMLAVLGVFGFILYVVIPPLLRQMISLYPWFSTPYAVDTLLKQFDVALDVLPSTIRDFVRAVVARLSGDLRGTLDSLLSRAVNLTVLGLSRLFEVVGFVLGILVIPTWLLAVLKDQRAAVRTLNRALPRWLAPDFWAVLRILDRAFGAFLRGQVFIAATVGVLTWLVLTAVDQQVGEPGIQYAQFAVLLAVIAAVMQLIPQIGPLVSGLAGILVGLTISTTAVVYIICVYILVQVVVNQTISVRLTRRVVNLSSVVLVLAIVALSNFGFAWVLLAAPLVGAVQDLFRYVYGRVSDPPLPAGVLPRDVAQQGVTTSVAASPQHVPSVYQRATQRTSER